MKPGPAPKPTALRMLNGNASKRPINKNEPKPSATKNLRSPVKLDKHARKFWNRYAQPLAELGLLSGLDLDLLAMGATWHSIHVRAVKELGGSLTQVSEANGNVA